MLTLHVSLSPPLNGDDRDDAFCDDGRGDDASFQSTIPFPSRLQALLRLWTLRLQRRSWMLALHKSQLEPESWQGPMPQSWKLPALCRWQGPTLCTLTR